MISVVIPLYNKEKSIGSTIRCVLNQTYTDFEIVVVDDGSTDNSANVVREFEDKRVRLICKENGGVSSARNEGILAARGEYISFLDGDDFWEPEYLETLNRLILDYPYASIYGIKRGCICNDHKIEDNKNSFVGYRGIVDDVWNNYPDSWTGSSSSSRKDLLLSIGLFDTRMAYGEDLDMWWRLLLIGDGAIDNTRTLMYYVQDSENRAMNKFIPFERHIPFYIEKYEKWRKENASFRKFFDTQCVYRLLQYATMPKYKKDIKRVLKQIDFSQLKLSMKLRFVFPRLYNLYARKRDA